MRDRVQRLFHMATSPWNSLSLSVYGPFVCTVFTLYFSPYLWVWLTSSMPISVAIFSRRVRTLGLFFSSGWLTSKLPLVRTTRIFLGLFFSRAVLKSARERAGSAPLRR